MTEAANVRLVRCPKCENLLPELPDYSLYQCGGCGAVLKAKKKGILEDGLSEISGDVKGIGISEEGSIVKVSEVDTENAGGVEGVRVEKLLNERVASNGSSKSLAESREVLGDPDIGKRGKESYSQGMVRNRNQGKICDLNVDMSEYVNFKSENTVKEIRPPTDSSRSRPLVDEWGVKSNFLYHDEGQSSYGLSSYYEHGERTRYQGGRIENFENDRAKLLRKLDELRDQISRSCEVAEKPDSYGLHRATYVQEGLNTSQGVNKKPLAATDTGRAPFLSHTPGFIPSQHMYGSSGPDPYIQNGYPRDFLPYRDVYQPEMLRRPPSQPQSQYMHRPHHEHFRGYYEDFNQELFMLHHQENIFHQPACSCAECRDKNWHMPPKVDPSGLQNRRSRNEPSNPYFHHHLNPLPPRPSNLYPLHSRRPITRNSIDLDSGNNGFNYRVPRKLTVDHRGGRVSYPVAGGAPFITCSNCFEILKLPTKNVSSAKDQQKMKCGACSSIISFELGDEGFISSVSPHVGEIPAEIGEGSMDENMRNWKYDSIYDKKSNSCESEKQLLPYSSTSSLSEDEESPESISSEKCQFENGNKSKRSEPERVSLDKTTSQSDVSVNEFSNSCASQDSTERSKEDHMKINKGGESFFAGFIKKSLRDFMKSNQSVEAGGSQVSVNGHFIADRVVKKAEKLAGPIQPGEYWYDKKAGFWGVMGHPCLGIIMPNIEEFNYPLPENCAAGNTGVFVNGRELNEKDLDLLASRGLPITKRKSYVIDITGKVVDERSGEELDALGKLAPTVEKAKHGFGMKVPKYISQSQS
ncbi:hypothetical protein BUALT_Bualt05G0046600 [Buddleja alternifolia]|uniref:Zinc-ribbon domain-containing protein n=1 Tax=Buddleja alternifolia TaxID=168488 RepID=A0AAV6XI40_9LAMI|nr:hypothetical protein BUALT_Bualt05G0046600 [Buddleja alternifolia]